MTRSFVKFLGLVSELFANGLRSVVVLYGYAGTAELFSTLISIYSLVELSLSFFDRFIFNDWAGVSK